MEPKPMKRDLIESIASAAVRDAVDFIESNIEPERQKAQRYFDGKVDLKVDGNRSKVVATKCRDAVRQVKPSLMRVFSSTDTPVEFVPRRPDAIEAAEQATNYAQYAYQRAGGYTLINGAFHDALVKKAGFLKVWWDETEKVDVDEYTGLTTMQLINIAQDGEVEVLEHSMRQEIGPQGPVDLHDAKVIRRSTTGEIAIKPIAPEDFFIDENATSLDDFYVCGHKKDMRVGDLVEMGFDFDEVVDLGTEEEDEEADFNRRGYVSDRDETPMDPSMRRVTVYECYMRIDVEGVGVPQLYSIILAGSGKKLLSYELADQVPFAAFEIDPEPHTFFGRSLCDILITEQEVGTAMLRGLIDNVIASNNPRLAFDQNTANSEDILNNEIGGLIRTNGPPQQAIFPVTLPDMASQSLGAMQYLDETTEWKTGVSRASMGLNPDALQATTATAVQATVQGAEGQVEVMARNLAEGGMKRLFRLIMKLAKQHASPGEMIRVDGRFVPVDPASWRADMDMAVNVGLGTGRRDEKAMVLRETLQNQLSLYTQFGGPMNGLVTLAQIRNTLVDIQDTAGIHNPDRYYSPLTPEQEQQLNQARQQMMSQQQGADPNAALAQAEIGKAQISAQQKSQSDIMKMQLEAQKAVAADDLARDRMAQDMILKSAEIQGRYSLAVDQARIQQMQQAPRQ